MPSKNMVRLGGAYVEITADNGKLVDALKDSESRIQTFVNEFAKTGAAFSALGLGVAAPMKKAVDTFAEFEKQMLITQAVTKATDAQLARLTKQAKDLGATTSWTAAQVAEGMVALGRMGFSNREIQGTISSVMDLGRALDTDVNQAAKELGAVMRQFQADSSEAGHYADALATATNGAAIEMDELLESMKYVGTAGNALGADVETVLALTMALRNAGVSASQAGTQLRSMFVSLQAPKNLQLFADKFGVEIYDANGRLKSFIDILVEAQKRAGALGDQLLLVARQMFGKLQAPGFLALLQSPDLERFRDMLYQCDGAAEAFREGMESGVYGSLKRSLSMVERVSIDLGESLAPTVREVEGAVKDITTYIGRFIEENKPLINLVAKTALEFGSLGATMLAGAGIMKGFAGTSRLVFTGAANIARAWRKAGEESKSLYLQVHELDGAFKSLATVAPGETLAASLNTAANAAKETTAAVEILIKAEKELGATISTSMPPNMRRTDTSGMSFSSGAGNFSVNSQKAGGAHFATTNGSSSVAGSVSAGQTFSIYPSNIVPKGYSGGAFSQGSAFSMSESEMINTLAKAARNRARYAQRYAQLEASINKRISDTQLGMTQKEATVLNNLRRKVFYYDSVVEQISQMRLRFTQAAPDDVGQYDYATSASAKGQSQFKINAQTMTATTGTITAATKANNEYSVSMKASAGNLSLVAGSAEKAASKVSAVGESAKRSALGMQTLKFAGGAALGVLKTFASMAVSMLAWTAVLKVFEGIAEYARKAAEDMRKAQESNNAIFDKDKQLADDAMSDAMSDEEKIDKLVSIAGSNKTLNNVEGQRLDALYDDLNNRGIVRGWVIPDPTQPSGYRVLNAGSADAMKGNAALYKSQELKAKGEELNVDLHSFDPSRFRKGVRANSEQVANFIDDYSSFAAALEKMTDEQKDELLGKNGLLKDNRLSTLIIGRVHGAGNKASQGLLDALDERLAGAGIAGSDAEAIKRGLLRLEGVTPDTLEYTADPTSGNGIWGKGAELKAFQETRGESFLSAFRQLKEFGASVKTANDLAAASEAYFKDAEANRDKPFNSEADAKQAEADAASAVADIKSKYAELDAMMVKAEDRNKTPSQRALDALDAKCKEIQERIGLDKEGKVDLSNLGEEDLKEYYKKEKWYLEAREELQKQINDELAKEREAEAKKNSEKVNEGLNADMKDFIGAIFSGNGKKADELGAGIDAQLRNFEGTDVDLSKFYEDSVATIKDALEKTKTTLASVGTFNALEFADFGRDVELDIQKEQLNMLRSANAGLQNIYAWMQTDDKYKEYM